MAALSCCDSMTLAVAGPALARLRACWIAHRSPARTGQHVATLYLPVIARVGEVWRASGSDEAMRRIKAWWVVWKDAFLPSDVCANFAVTPAAMANAAPLPTVRTFACGHVIPPSQILPLSVGRGPTNVTFDFTYRSRTTPQQLDELGRLLVNVCNMTPQGVVCFLPSYEYERVALAHWTVTRALGSIDAKVRCWTK